MASSDSDGEHVGERARPAPTSSSTIPRTSRRAGALRARRRRRPPTRRRTAARPRGPHRRARTGRERRAEAPARRSGRSPRRARRRATGCARAAPTPRARPGRPAAGPGGSRGRHAPGSGANMRPSRQSTTSYERVRLLDLLEVEHARAHVGEAARLAARAAAIDVISATTSDSTTSPSGPTRSAAANPTRRRPQANSSTRSPGSRRRPARASRRHRGAACVDVVRMLAPPPGHRRPHAVDVGSDARRLLRRLRCFHDPSVLVNIRYSLRVMNSSLD